jgi:hypothetical protein
LESAGPRCAITFPKTKSTWKKQLGTRTEKVWVPPLKVAVCDRKTTCWDAVSREKVALGAV